MEENKTSKIPSEGRRERTLKPGLSQDDVDKFRKLEEDLPGAWAWYDSWMDDA